MANKRRINNLSEAEEVPRRKTKRPKKETVKNKVSKKKITRDEEEQEITKETLDKNMNEDGDLSDDDDNESLDDVSHAKGTDPFSEHFEKEISEDLASKLLSNDKATTSSIWTSGEVVLSHLGKADFLKPTDSSETFPSFDESDLLSLHVKKSLVDQLPVANLWNSDHSGHLSKLQLELFTVFSSYKDLYFPHRTHKNGEEIRLAYCLHALNHVLKTRTRIIKNNKKIEKKKDDCADECRDQGLTRPKVLIVLPFRDSALKVVHIMMKLLSNKEYTVASKNRFESEYGSELDVKKGRKPEDYEVTFDGNIDDQFRIGIGVSKKSLKLYEEFYSSDIILASPLGLWKIIGAQNEKERDFEFLSSIEVLIFDQMDVFFMQNFEHVMHIFSNLHQIPKETHGVDYFRVRMWALNGWSKVYRQTLMFGSITHPMIETVFRRHCANYCGKLKVLSLPSSGTINDVHGTSPLVQIFQRVNLSSLQESPDSRFDFFVKQILPKYTDNLISGQTLIFVSSYFDFVRLRNYFAKEEKNAPEVTFGLLSEYSQKGGISRARQFFKEKKIRFLLFTERFHFFRRYNIGGIQHLIFYDLPIYPHFYPELCNMIQDSKDSEAMEHFNRSCTVLFTKYEADRLVPVVGYDKACELIASEKNVHTFHAS